MQCSNYIGHHCCVCNMNLGGARELFAHCVRFGANALGQHSIYGSFMTGLKCPMICREREDSGIACKVRKCCIDRGFYACYECDDFEVCDKLKSLMEGLHYDASVKNLKAIKEMGLETWITRGKRHCYWSEGDACL